MLRQITSRDNDKIKAVCRLRDSTAFRQQENSYMAEGLKLCRDLCAVIKPKEIYITEKALDSFQDAPSLCEECYIVSDHVAQKLSDAKTSQGLFCVFDMPESTRLFKGRWLCLENVQDPANVGAALRSAAAFGFDGAVLSKGCADAFSQKALRSSMGAAARLPLYFADDFLQTLCELKQQGCTLIAAALQNSKPLEEARDIKSPCLVIGSEGQGLTQQTVEVCNIAVRIPITNKVESLNAAAAASVLMWHFRGC